MNLPILDQKYDMDTVHEMHWTSSLEDLVLFLLDNNGIFVFNCAPQYAERIVFDFKNKIIYVEMPFNRREIIAEGDEWAVDYIIVGYLGTIYKIDIANIPLFNVIPKASADVLLSLYLISSYIHQNNNWVNRYFNAVDNREKLFRDYNLKFLMKSFNSDMIDIDSPRSIRRIKFEIHFYRSIITKTYWHGFSHGNVNELLTGSKRFLKHKNQDFSIVLKKEFL